MPSLEYVVRPFQSPGALGGLVIPSTPQPTNERATLTWGAKSDVPPVKQSVGFAGCCQEDATERDQQYEPVTIYNQGSDGGSVSFQRAHKFNFDKTSKDQCAGDWDQFSGVGLEITDALEQFAADIASGTAAGDDQPNTCKGVMSLTNTPTGT